MSSSYINIIKQYNVNNTFTSISALLILSIYLLAITTIPVLNAIYIKHQINNTHYAAAITKPVKDTQDNKIVTTSYISAGQMLSRQVDNNKLQSYISDAKGSVLKLNNQNGSSQDNYSYDAYGKPITDTKKPNPALDVINPFQYNGERFDTNTGDQYLRARFYNPNIKRFLNQDSYDLLNRFNFVNGNPVMGVDPSGHDVASALVLTAVTVISIVTIVFVIKKLTHNNKSFILPDMPKRIKSAKFLTGSTRNPSMANDYSAINFLGNITDEQFAKILSHNHMLDTEQVHYITFHGNEGIASIPSVEHPEKYTKKNNDEFITDVLIPAGYDGKDGITLMLVSCYSGKGENSLAQNVSDRLGVNVLAPLDELVIQRWCFKNKAPLYVYGYSKKIEDLGDGWKLFKPRTQDNISA